MICNYSECDYHNDLRVLSSIGALILGSSLVVYIVTNKFNVNFYIISNKISFLYWV